MRNHSRRQASTRKPSDRASVEQDKRALEAGFLSDQQSAARHTRSLSQLLKSIFGTEKVQRLSAAARFSFGDAGVRRSGGRYAHIKRVGLLLVLLFLQSLFIALDYLPVTLEILGRERSCLHVSAPRSEPKEHAKND